MATLMAGHRKMGESKQVDSGPASFDVILTPT